MTSTRPRFGLAFLLNTLATVQVTWFYLERVPSALNLAAYEQGHERLPFQERVLMMAPLRWAHDTPATHHLAAAIARAPGWFGPHPGGVAPETAVSAAIDLLCVALTGLAARAIYRAASPTGLFAPLVYPLTLAMTAITYCFATQHGLRFPYDLPAMAFFAAGLYLVYFRRHWLLFAALFLVTTLNRETTLLLLPLYALAQCVPARNAGSAPAGASIRWLGLWAPRTLAIVGPLAAYWLGWHVWVARHFAGNASAEAPRLLLNLATLLCPLAWPQLASVAAYLWPLPLLYRRSISDPLLRAWVWLPLGWLGFMLFFGLLIETRVFGELIPYYACTAALLFEGVFLKRLNAASSTETKAYPTAEAASLVKR